MLYIIRICIIYALLFLYAKMKLLHRKQIFLSFAIKCKNSMNIKGEFFLESMENHSLICNIFVCYKFVKRTHGQKKNNFVCNKIFCKGKLKNSWISNRISLKKLSVSLSA